MVKKVEGKKIKCTGKCGRELVVNNNFYQSKSPFFPEGYVNICKKCITNMVDYNDLNSVYGVMQILDIPFYYNRWQETCEKKPNNPLGNYIRMANSGINEFSGARYKDSVFNASNDVNLDKYSFDDIEKDLLNDFRPTKEMLLRWGTRYEAEQYIKLENFYNDMKEKNNIETPQDEDYLRKLAVISMKMDEELEMGNYSQAKSLGDLFSKYMADSKFRAMDKTEADKTGGLRSFSSIYAEVEKDDFIPPWEHYRKIKGLTQDIVDKCIMHMENFTLRLNRVEKMVEPPSDTPKLTSDETTEKIGGSIG